MSRTWFALLVLVLLTPVRAEPDKKVKKVERQRLRIRLRPGARYAGSNTVSHTIVTTVREGDKRTSSSESLQHTERFVDEVTRANEGGEFELKRNYLRVYAKMRDSERARPKVRQSPMQGRSVTIRENRRRREIVLDGRGTVEAHVRLVAGMELDWRDILPEEAIAPGDSWSADVSGLARRLAAYLRCGRRSRMKVRFEEITVREGTRQAKFYVDWTIEGMRDRQLFTKVTVAGDVYYDFAEQRIVHVDVGGSMLVAGSMIIGDKTRIVKGEGPVNIQTTIKPAPLQAAPDDEE